MSNLLLLTIGPVQSFIAQARKTQDLFAGSRLLSDLCRTAMNVVGTEYVVYPDATSESLPNRFAAILNLSFAEAEQKALEAERQVHSQLWIEAERVYNEKARRPMLQAYRQQIEKHLQVSWIVVPIGEEPFGEIFKKANRLLESIKNTNQFTQFEQTINVFGERGRKCSVDGERNALLFGAETNQNYIDLNNGNELHELQKVYLDENEGLSAVSFTKRFYKQGQFDAPSVAEIALKHLEYPETIEKRHRAFKEYEEKLQNECNVRYFDSQLCLPENLTTDYFEPEHLTRAKELHSTLVSYLIGENQDRHYAVLRFDGDNMGQWLSGKFCGNDDLAKFQKTLSQLLSKFGEHANREILTKRYGATVYAGGDDFIGFVNLNYLFKILAELRVAYKHFISDQLIRLYPDLRKEFTFSAGIALAHYKTPLNIVLDEARNAEHFAKDFKGKDAVGIYRIKKSGEIQKCRFPFGEIKYVQGGDGSLKADAGVSINQINEVFRLLRKGISTKFIKNYQNEFVLLGDEFVGAQPEMARVELLRLINRSRNKSGEKANAADAQALAQALAPFQSMSGFNELLTIIDFMHRQTTDPCKAQKSSH